MNRIVADLRADLGDTHVDGTVLAVIAHTAQGSEDLFARQYPPGVAGQQPEQVEFGAGQVYQLLAQPGFTRALVDAQFAEARSWSLPWAGSLRLSSAWIRASNRRGRTGLQT